MTRTRDNAEAPGPRETIAGIVQTVRGGHRSAAEALDECLTRIGIVNDTLNALVQIDAERARAQASELDRRRDAGETLGPLAGAPIAIKDNMCTTWGQTTAASRMLAGYRSPFDATVVRRLLAADALIIGKANMDEFAMGSSNEHSAHGPCVNPWNAGRVPGGSSGGSAAAVAAGLAPAALGSDTGGSIRQPAAFCGVVGLRPTYGRVSRHGLVAFASSLDQIGPITTTVDDAAMVLNVIAGPDPRDATTVDAPPLSIDEVVSGRVDDLRIGLVSSFLNEHNDDAVNEAVQAAAETFARLGADVVEVDLHDADYGIACHYIIANAEASSNFARYDGVRFAHRSHVPELTTDAMYAASRSEGFGEEVRRRIMLGTYVLAAGHYDAYYKRALQARRLIRRSFDETFSRVDLLLMPTAPEPAFAVGSRVDDPWQMYLSDVYTVPSSVVGLPGVSIPARILNRDGERLPLAIQLVGPPFCEETMLRAAHAYERARGPIDYAACR
jgi:aspartyl-tRNA(Asn)/glutamyl-tRNA(Gln) amidotransferase subunit A